VIDMALKKDCNERERGLKVFKITKQNLLITLYAREPSQGVQYGSVGYAYEQTYSTC